MNLYTKMKKAAGAVLAVAMGMTCIPTPLAVYAQEPEEYTVILDENFESELSAGVKLSGGVSVVEMDGNHVLEFNDTSDSETSKANIEIGKQAGEIVVEYKLYVVSDEGKSTIALTAGSKEESGSSSTSSAGEFLRFKTTGSDSRTYEFRGGDSQKTPSVKNGAYLCGKWIELKSVIDTATKTFDVYADGELLGENIAMSCKTENIVMESLDNISFLTGSMDKTHAYIDDVRVSLKTTDSGEGDGDGEDEKTPGELGCIDFVAGGSEIAARRCRKRYQARLGAGKIAAGTGRTATPVSFSLRLLTKTDKTPWCSTARYRDSKPEAPLMPVPRCGKCWTLRTKR